MSHKDIQNILVGHFLGTQFMSDFQRHFEDILKKVVEGSGTSKVVELEEGGELL